MCGPKPKGENVEGFLFTKKERVNNAHNFPSQAPQNKYGKSQAAIFSEAY